MLVDYLSKTLVLSSEYITTVSKTASQRYKRIEIDKKNGKKRVIYQPSRELKALQRVIHDDLLSAFPLHHSAKAYKKGEGTLKNASVHVGAKFLLRLDFKNFFESIKKDDVRFYIERTFPSRFLTWTSEDTNILCELVCFNARLTVGSVTSPLLSNLMCNELDSEIAKLCASLNVKYTRYADDMYFSTDVRDVLIEFPRNIKKIVRNLSCPKSLWINYDKTIHSSRKRQMSVTGLVLTNSGEVSIGRKKKREIRSLVYKWNELSAKEKSHLSGYLAYCTSVEPDFINALCGKYGAKTIREIQTYSCS